MRLNAANISKLKDFSVFSCHFQIIPANLIQLVDRLVVNMHEQLFGAQALIIELI